MRLLLFVVLAVLVNLPVAHEHWTDHQVATRGREVEAVVVHLRRIGDRALVDYTLPRDLDRDQVVYSAAIDEASYEVARSSDRLAVRVVPGDPNKNRPDGLVASSLFTVIAVLGDAVLALAAALSWYRRRRPNA